MIEDKRSYFQYTPANVMENDNFKMYWNGRIITVKITSDLT
jgi:hypothetical protein